MTVEPKRRGRKRGPGGPNPVDLHVGGRLRLRRTLLGMSQGKLAEALDMTFQQVQKYERGTNRISSSRLFDLSLALDVPVDYFFEGMTGEVAAASPVQQHGGSPDQDRQAFDFAQDPMAMRETLELIRVYYELPTESLRRELFELIKALSKAITDKEPKG